MTVIVPASATGELLLARVWRWRHRLPQRLRWRWHWFWNQIDTIHQCGFRFFGRHKAVRAVLWAQDRLAARRYEELRPEEVAQRRRSDTVFVFGSGYSLNELTPAEWRHISEHDVFGFSGFIYQRWVRVDFHLIRSWTFFRERARLLQQAVVYAGYLRDNPFFANSVLFLQREFSAEFSNMFTAARLLNPGTRVCRYHAAHRVDDMPSQRWSDGVMRDLGTLATAVNVAYLLGWKKIVLVGVDLYDSRYFWGPPTATLQADDTGDYRKVTEDTDRGVPWHQPHNTTQYGVIDIFRQWAALFESRGVQLTVYNPRSLLAGPLRVYGECLSSGGGAR